MIIRPYKQTRDESEDATRLWRVYQIWWHRKKSNICVTRDFRRISRTPKYAQFFENRASLDLGLFTKSSETDFLHVHQLWEKEKCGLINFVLTWKISGCKKHKFIANGVCIPPRWKKAVFKEKIAKSDVFDWQQKVKSIYIKIVAQRAALDLWKLNSGKKAGREEKKLYRF